MLCSLLLSGFPLPFTLDRHTDTHTHIVLGDRRLLTCVFVHPSPALVRHLVVEHDIVEAGGASAVPLGLGLGLGLGRGGPTEIIVLHGHGVEVLGVVAALLPREAVVAVTAR